MSGEAPHRIAGLKPGRYVLTETLPPAIYDAADPVEIVLEDSGADQKDVYKRQDYFQSKGAWRGPKFGPMLWAKHPKAWDGKSMTAAKIESEIDAMLLEVRSGFRIIRSLGSIYEERLMEKYLEGDSLSMGPVFAYLAHLTEEAAYIASGGSRWSGWTPDLDLDDEPVASEDVSLRGAPSRIAALKEIAEAIGLTVNGSSCGNDASMVEVLRSRGFSDQQVDRIVTAKEVFGMTSAQVRCV